jgi:hypothetical protein
MIYDTQDYWVFGHCPSFDILKNKKEKNVSKKVQHLNTTDT